MTLQNTKQEKIQHHPETNEEWADFFDSMDKNISPYSNYKGMLIEIVVASIFETSKNDDNQYICQIHQKLNGFDFQSESDPNISKDQAEHQAATQLLQKIQVKFTEQIQIIEKTFAQMIEERDKTFPQPPTTLMQKINYHNPERYRTEELEKWSSFQILCDKLSDPMDILTWLVRDNIYPLWGEINVWIGGRYYNNPNYSGSRYKNHGKIQKAEDQKLAKQILIGVLENFIKIIQTERTEIYIEIAYIWTWQIIHYFFKDTDIKGVFLSVLLEEMELSSDLISIDSSEIINAAQCLGLDITSFEKGKKIESIRKAYFDKKNNNKL